MDEHALDPIYLGLAEGVPLLSDDMKYRAVATVVGLTRRAMAASGLACRHCAPASRSARASIVAFVQLAARKHRHVTLDPAALRGIYDLSGDKLAEFKAATSYIGSPDADMAAHVQVTAALLLDLWSVQPSRRSGAIGDGIDHREVAPLAYAGLGAMARAADRLHPWQSRSLGYVGMGWSDTFCPSRR